MKRAAQAVALALLLCAGRAEALTERFAVIVGNNAADREQTALRFAEDDASKMARVLTDLGGVSPDDLQLLQGRGLAALRAALSVVRRKVTARHRDPGSRAMLVFYFSGHSDGVALELGPDRLPFDTLRQALSATGADVRVAIIDSCRSGALLASKGIKPGPAFDIRLSDDLPSEGLVLLTSSAANEEALESSEIGGSFFTHHLVSGLRGAADSSGDGRVTLAEAYRYAYARTVEATARTLVGPQHPAYDYRVSGMGEIVLTETQGSTASIVLPAGFDRALVADSGRNEVLAEVPSGAPNRVAVPSGTYLVMLWKQGHAFVGRFDVGARAERLVAWADVSPAHDAAAVQTKGPNPSLNASELDRAIQLFEHFDDRAASAFKELLARRPSPPVAARAHLYLGLIALNGLDSEQAAAEFKQALLADPITELPQRDSSPKAEMAFERTKGLLAQELARQSNAPLEMSPETPAGTLGTALNPQALSADSHEPSVEVAPARRSHVLAFALGGAALVSGALAVYGGVQVLDYAGDVNAPRGTYQANQISASGQISSAAANAGFWRYGWVVAAGVSAALLGGAALAW